MTTLFLLAIIALLVGTAAIYMALIKPFPVEWLYYHYHIRKPVVWAILGGSLLWELWLTISTGSFQLEVLVPIGLMGLAVILAYRMHQESAFPAVDFPEMSDDPSQLLPWGEVKHLDNLDQVCPRRLNKQGPTRLGTRSLPDLR
jgi:hypothetical protein